MTDLDAIRYELEQIRALVASRHESFLSLRDVSEKTTLSTTEIKRRIRDGAFPEPVELGPQRKAWPASHVHGWISAMVRGEEWRQNGR